MLATSSVSVLNVNDGQDGAPGAQGPQGISVIGSREQWFLSTSNTGLAGSPNTIDVNGVSVLVGQWTYTEPAVIPDGYYLWGRIENTFAGVDNAEIASSDGLLASSDGTLACGYYSSPVLQYSDAIYRSVISGIKSMVDYNRKAITDKVWETDIENHVYSADDGDGGYTMSSISDRVTQTEQDIGGITATVSEVQSQVDNKADGSTVQTLSENFSTFQQMMGGFKTTVEQNYAQTSYVDQQIGNIKVGGDNLYIIADQVPGYLHQSNGSISTQNATGKEFTSAYIPVKEGENIIIQSWCTPLTEAGVENPGYSWLAYQFFSDDDPVTPVGNRVAKWGYSSGSGVETTADGKERLMYKVVAPANANYIRMSYRSYEDGYAMVEQATTPSEYAIATADLQNESSRIRTIAEQTAEGFSWIVEDGSSASSVTYTSNAVNAMAEQINLSGKVTFSAFDTDTQNALTSDTELIIGTQTESTSAWTGKSLKLKSIASGTRISYKLPYASTSTAVTLNLTLSNNTATGEKEVYYLNTTRLSTQYGVNSIIELIYDGSAWRVLNPYTNSSTYDRIRYQQNIQAGATAIVAGNIIVAGVGTAKYTHLKLGNAFDTTYPILYAAGALAVNATGNNNYIVFPLTLTTTQSGTYTAYKPVYIKGTLSGTTFTPVSATPLTQTVPTSADGYHYILLGTTYSTSGMYLLGEHPIYMYHDGGFKTVAQIAAEAATNASNAVTTANTANGKADNAVSTANTASENATAAVDWISTNGSTVITVSDIMKTWTGDATLATTTIDGGYIKTHTIESEHLATDAIMSNNYEENTLSVYSTTGTFLDLANGNITSPTFAVDNTNGTAYIDGTISARNLLVGTADAASDYLIYDGESILIKTDNFSIDSAGNVTMTGSVNTNSGYIGGWEITEESLRNGSSIGSAGSVHLVPEGSTTYHTIGGSDELNGWVITAGDSFGVTKDGALYANDANITGAFTITDGGIGGMTIDSDTISTTTSGMSSNTSKQAFWAGETNGSYGTTSTDAKFKVGHDGKLTATNAEITGKITTQSGTIGGWKIDDDSLYYSTAETPQVGDSNSVFLMPNGTSSNVTIAGVTSRGWVITAGDSFGVTRTGSVYANNGKIGGVTLSGGNIYAYNTTGTSSGSVAFQLLSNGYLSIGVGNQITMNTAGVLSIPALCVTGELTANQIAAGAITASKLSVTIGGNNLLRNSHADKTGSSTPWIWTYGPNPPKSGDKLTFQVKGSSLGSSQQIVTFGVTHTISLAYNSTTGTYVGTFTLSVSNSSDTYFRFNPGSTSATCDWVKLEYGDMATPWSPSPDEAAGFDVDATAIHTSNVPVSSNADNSTALSSADFSRIINGITYTNLRFAIGAHFGVSGTGALYSSSGIIGGLTIGSNYMSYGTIGQDASTFIGAVNYGLSHNNAKATVANYNTDTWRLTVGMNFGVTGSGMYATGGQIGGFTIGKNTISSNTANGTSTVAFTISSLSNYSAVLIRQNSNYYTRVGLSEIEVVGGTGTTISAGTISTNEIQAAGEIQTTAVGSGGTVKLHSGIDNGLFAQNRLTDGTNQEVRFILNNNSNAGIFDVTKQRWALVYNINNGTMASNSQISVASDERIKTIRRHLNNDHKSLFMALDPIEFSFIDKPDEIHFGFGAQTTEISMKKLGFGSEYNLVSHPLNGEMDIYGRRDSYYMNYIEALMLSVPVVQDHEKEIAKLKTKIEELENKLSQLTQ